MRLILTLVASLIPVSAHAEPPAGMLEMCALCHGDKGQGIEARSGPKLAGLSQAYLANQLRKFKSGQRGTHPADLFGPQMYVITQSWKGADIDAIATAYAEMHEPLPIATLSGDAQRGATLFETCAGCHGEQGEGVEDLQAPRLAYQTDWAIYHSLKTYMAGARGYNDDDDWGWQMRASVEDVLSDEDAKDLASYIATLRPQRSSGE